LVPLAATLCVHLHLKPFTAEFHLAPMGLDRCWIIKHSGFSDETYTDL